MDHFVQMADGTKYGMNDQQEADARKYGLITTAMDDGSWSWNATIGEDFSFETEQEAWAAGLQAIEDWISYEND